MEILIEEIKKELRQLKLLGRQISALTGDEDVNRCINGIERTINQISQSVRDAESKLDHYRNATIEHL